MEVKAGREGEKEFRERCRKRKENGGKDMSI